MRNRSVKICIVYSLSKSTLLIRSAYKEVFYSFHDFKDIIALIIYAYMVMQKNDK